MQQTIDYIALLNSLEITSAHHGKTEDGEYYCENVMVKYTPEVRRVLEQINTPDIDDYLVMYGKEIDGVIKEVDISQAAFCYTMAYFFDGEKFLDFETYEKEYGDTENSHVFTEERIAKNYAVIQPNYPDRAYFIFYALVGKQGEDLCKRYQFQWYMTKDENEIGRPLDNEIYPSLISATSVIKDSGWDNMYLYCKYIDRISNEEYKTEFIQLKSDFREMDQNSFDSIETANPDGTISKKVYKYRMGYCYCFIGDYMYKDASMCGVDVCLVFSVFKDGKEVIFESEEPDSEQYILLNDGLEYPLSSLVDCSFDREKLLDIYINPKFESLIKESNYTIDWKIDHCWTFAERAKDNIKITEEELMDIFKNNVEEFDNSDNYSAQVPSYFTVQI